ncbi:hypothetical protein F385_1177 [Pantoea agglomerans 299R]|nr:hypothetical protein F385_1177 [Pantoea agglomerans 299R]
MPRFWPVYRPLAKIKRLKTGANGIRIARVAQQRRDSNKAERIKRDFYRALWENAISPQIV